MNQCKGRIDRRQFHAPWWLPGAVFTLVVLAGCPADLTPQAPNGAAESGDQNGVTASPDTGATSLDKRFAECFAADAGCVAGLLDTRTPSPAAPAGVAAEPQLATLVAEAKAYLEAATAEAVAGHWRAFMTTLESYQKGSPPHPGWSASTAALVLPEGDFVAGCATWSGVYREVGSFASAADPEYEGSLTFELTCPENQRCGEKTPYRASIDITEASPDGATGTGLWLHYDAVPVRSLGNLLVAYAESDLYETLALAAGPESWCVNRPPPCRSPGARAGDVLFALMVNCSEASGVLQWGTLKP